jgi:hypothetical protein
VQKEDGAPSAVELSNASFLNDSDSESSGDESTRPRKKNNLTTAFLQLAAKFDQNSSLHAAPEAQKESGKRRTYEELYRMSLERKKYEGSSGGGGSIGLNNVGGGRAISDAIVDVSADSLFVQVLGLNLKSVCEEMQGRKNEEEEGAQSTSFAKVPVRFLHESAYISAFEPLLVDEVKAALGSHITQWDTNASKRRSYNQQSGDGKDFVSVSLRFSSRAARPSCQLLQEVQLTSSLNSCKKHFVKDDLVLILKAGLPKGNLPSKLLTFYNVI